MGRPERPVDTSAGPAAEFAERLRSLRRQAGNPPYRQLARDTRYSVTALSDAAGGQRLPSLDVTLAYVGACGGDRAQWERDWQAVKAEVAEAEACTDEPDQPLSAPPLSPPTDVGPTTGTGSARPGRRRLGVLAATLVSGVALGVAGTAAVLLPGASHVQATGGGDASATPSAWQSIAARSPDTAHPGDGMDPIRVGCAGARATKYISNLDSVPVYLPGAKKFGDLVMRNNPGCNAMSWGTVYGSVGPDAKVYITAYRPADRASTLSWYGGTSTSAYGWMLSTEPGCVYIEAYVRTPSGKGPTARTQCL
ncbi:helix-turn-helix domain-containing protein [Streptomyces sp. NBC_00079]|uniref:helix-turn-helix domain-containing protein n=1 Tax=Streptomyces sp. NBC_00079 TaxID=2975644 RepID=UPI0032501F40